MSGSLPRFHCNSSLTPSLSEGVKIFFQQAANRTAAYVRLLVAFVAVLGADAAAVALPTVNGTVQYETFGYPDPDRHGPNWENFFAATVRSHGEITPTLTWEFEGRAVADDVNFTAGGY